MIVNYGLKLETLYVCKLGFPRIIPRADKVFMEEVRNVGREMIPLFTDPSLIKDGIELKVFFAVKKVV
jgi:hypothetical protein